MIFLSRCRGKIESQTPEIPKAAGFQVLYSTGAIVRARRMPRVAATTSNSFLLRLPSNLSSLISQVARVSSAGPGSVVASGLTETHSPDPASMLDPISVSHVSPVCWEVLCVTCSGVTVLLFPSRVLVPRGTSRWDEYLTCSTRSSVTAACGQADLRNRRGRWWKHGGQRSTFSLHD